MKSSSKVRMRKRRPLASASVTQSSVLILRGPPLVERRIADAVLPAQIARRKTGSVFFQNLDNLLFREPPLTHRLFPYWWTES